MLSGPVEGLAVLDITPKLANALTKDDNVFEGNEGLVASFQRRTADTDESASILLR